MPAPEVAPSRPLAAKLGIGGAMTVVLVGAPPEVEQLLAPVGPGVTLTRSLRRGVRVDVALCFVTTRATLERRLEGLLERLEGGGVLWVAWPKKSSGVPTDLSDQVIRSLVAPRGWVDTKVCAIDPTWSGLKFVLRGQRRHRARPTPAAAPPASTSGRPLGAR